jgi:DNA-binding beta-propeller fold protein YncE
MRSLKLFGLILAVALTAPSLANAEYKILERVKVGDGGFDYATFDPATNRVYMTRTAYTTVIDVKTNKASQMANAAPGHMALPIPGTSLVLLPQRKGSINNGDQGTIRIVDTATEAVVADLPGGTNPDGAVYDPFSKLAFVMNQLSGEATVVDAVGKKIVATIKVPGKLEFPATDGAGKVYVVDESVPNTNIAVMDAKSFTAAPDRYPLQGCVEATGLAYVTQHKLLVASCKNEMAKVLEAATGKEVASIKIGKGPDAVLYDAMRQLVFIPCGIDGVLEVISVADPAKIAVVQHLPTQAGSRTGTIDPATGRLYLMASKPDPAAVPPPGGGGVPRLAGSFEVLVVAP